MVKITVFPNAHGIVKTDNYFSNRFNITRTDTFYRDAVAVRHRKPGFDKLAGLQMISKEFETLVNKVLLHTRHNSAEVAMLCDQLKAFYLQILPIYMVNMVFHPFTNRLDVTWGYT